MTHDSGATLEVSKEVPEEFTLDETKGYPSLEYRTVTEAAREAEGTSMDHDSRMKELLWSGVRHAIDAAGGTKAGLARAVGCTPGAITQWCKRGKIPVERCAVIEANLGVPRETTRPDIFERGDVA